MPTAVPRRSKDAARPSGDKRKLVVVPVGLVGIGSWLRCLVWIVLHEFSSVR